MIASVERQEITRAFCAARQPANSPASAQAVETWVPLISASPSFGPSSTGASPAAASASAAGVARPATVASPSPIRTAARCASGARSPEAPTEPCTGMTGVTPRASMPSSSAISSQRTPDAPRPSDSSFNAIVSRTIGSGVGSPTPAQWERTRLRCSAAVSSGAILTLASLPKPVFTP